MAGKLTEEQKAEIGRRYEAGESQRKIAQEMKVPRAIVKWVLVLSEKIDPGQTAPVGTVALVTRHHAVSVIELFRDGWNQSMIAKELGLADPHVSAICSAAGLERSKSEANIIGWGKPIHKSSQDALRTRYWGSRSGFPSVEAIAREEGVSASTVRLAFQRAGIDLRGLSEQHRKEWSEGRREKMVRKSRPGYPHWLKPYVEGLKGKPRPRALVEKSAKACRKWSSRICHWCGGTVDHKGKQLYPRCFCNQECMNAANRWGFRRQSRQNDPRPLILNRLRDLLHLEPLKALPRNYETLEKAGSTIGATDAEYAEIMAEWAQG